MNVPAAAAEHDESAASPSPYIHATALVIGEAGILIRGPSGAGKSRLALELIAEASRRGLFAQLVGDDRVAIEARGGRLIARGHPTIAGQIESRGEGIVDLAYESSVVIRLVLDLGGEAARSPPRLPRPGAQTSLSGVFIPQLSLDGPGSPQAGMVIGHLLRMGNG
jgi:serine kinase of HPr protein (carbohydrate metabolism regulator)